MPRCEQPRNEEYPICHTPPLFHSEQGRKAVDEAKAGDIVVFAGVPEFNIGDTLVDVEVVPIASVTYCDCVGRPETTSLILPALLE